MASPKTLSSPRFVSLLDPCNTPINRCPVPRESAEHRFLIMRVGALGDILMATVILPPLRERFPNAHFTWVAETGESASLLANPYIDEVIIWDTMFWKKLVRGMKYFPWFAEMAAFQRELKARQFDTFVSFQPEEWPLLTLGNGAGVKIGVFDTFRRYYRAQKTSANKRLYTHAYAHPNLPDHRIDQYLLTLDALGVPYPAEKRMLLGYTTEDKAVAERFLTDRGIGLEERFVILVPQTTWGTKCWPADRFVALANRLTKDGVRIILSGSPKEAEYVRTIAAQISPAPVVVAGETTFRQFAALLDRAALLVSGDTGPMHAAAALRTPYVSLFGPTSPKWYGPLTGPGIVLSHQVPCGPCDQKFCPNQGEAFELCMRLLTIDEVTLACQQLLNDTSQS